MILGTVGSVPFIRLVRMLDECAAMDRTRDYVIQSADPVFVPTAAQCVPYLDHRDLIKYMETAEVVVAHAGVGTILEASGLRKPLVLVPRLAELREAINDHQLEISRFLHDTYGIPIVRADNDLAQAIVQAAAIPLTPNPSTLAERIKRYVDSIRSRP